MVPASASEQSDLVSSKDIAQRRADQIAVFRAELEQLAREGVVPFSDAERARVIEHQDELLQQLARDFDVDRTETERQMSAGMRVASLLGAAALTAAVVSFFYRVWGGVPTAGQVALVTSAPILSLVIVGIAAHLEKTRYVASLFAVVACGAFVLQVVVLGQIFNLRSSPHGVALCALFALAVGIPWRFAVPFALGAIALVFYVPAVTLDVLGFAWANVPDRPELLGVSAAVGLLALSRVPPELVTWGRPLLLTIALAVLLMMTMALPPTILPLGEEVVEIGYQVVSVVVTIALVAFGLRRGLNDVVILGSIFGGAFLLGRFVDWWWDWMPKYLFFLILAALALGWLWGLRVARRHLAESRP
jgi:hypothetical protein